MSNHAYVFFGRLNPPQIGHGKLLEQLNVVPENNRFIFLSQTQDNIKNPLSWAEKVKAVERGFGIKVNRDLSVKNPFQALEAAQKAGFKEITLLIGADRVETFTKMLQSFSRQYPDVIVHIKPNGEERFTDESGREYSATRMRKDVETNNVEDFIKIAPPGLSLKEKLELMKKVKSGLGEQNNMTGSIISEGGNMFPGVTSRIRQEDVEATIDDLDSRLFRPLGLKRGVDWKPVGSTGKKAAGETSGDLDIAISSEKAFEVLKAKDINDALKKMEQLVSKTITSNVKSSAGFKEVSFAFPVTSDIDGDKKVQVDIMWGNLDWAEFAYHSPSSEMKSKYKGEVFALLRATIISYLNPPTIIEGNAENPITYKKIVFTQASGLDEVTYTFRSQTDENKILKTKRIVSRKQISNDPAYVKSMILRRGYTQADAPIFNSFETLWNYVKTNYPAGDVSKLQDTLKKAYAETGTMSTPSELNEAYKSGNILTEQYLKFNKKLILEAIVNGKKFGISHIEDLALVGESEAAIDALVSLSDIGQETVTTKYDGSVALHFGYDPANPKKFFVGTKAIYSKGEPKIIYKPSDADKWYGDKPGLVNVLKTALIILPQITPAGRAFVGDLMYLKGNDSLTEKDGSWYFKPNIIEYKVPIDSEEGRKIAESEMGIAIHTELRGETVGSTTGTPISANVLKSTADVWIAPLKISKQKIPDTLKTAIASAKSYYESNKQVIDSFPIEYPALARSVATWVAGLPKTGNMNLTAERFKADKPKTSVENPKALDTVFSLMNKIALTKKEMIAALSAGVPIGAGALGHEGFVIPSGESNLIKIVDRMAFTLANQTK